MREAAKSVYLTSTLDTTNPLPNRKCYPRDGKAMTINNLKMRTTLWGPVDRITISLTKNDVWDRRVNPRGFVAPTLQEIIGGAKANLQYILGMTSNIYAVRGKLTGINTPVWLRL